MGVSGNWSKFFLGLLTLIVFSSDIIYKPNWPILGWCGPGLYADMHRRGAGQGALLPPQRGQIKPLQLPVIGPEKSYTGCGLGLDSAKVSRQCLLLKQIFMAKRP